MHPWVASLASVNAFGPNTALVSEYISRIESFPWLSRIEKPHPNHVPITRVPMTWLLDRPERPWRGALAANEARIERHLLDTGRLEFQVALDRYYRPSFGTRLDSLLIDIDQRFSSYYNQTDLYPHELLDSAPIERVVRFSLYECIVDDLIPHATFFRSLLDWFARGYWPCGWSADYPEGQLLVL